MGLTKKRTILLIPVITVAAWVAIVEVNNIVDPGLHPGSYSSLDERYLDAERRLDSMVDQIQRDISNTANITEIDRLEKVLEGALDFQRMAEIGKELETAADEEEKERLLAELHGVEERLKEHAGDRYVHTTVQPNGSRTVVTPHNVTVLPPPYVPWP